MLTPEPMNATYFREYGIHPVKQQDGADYIASFPNWDEAIDALKSDFPKDGNIVTPEYIAAPNDLTKITQSTELVDERIRAAMDLTQRSDAVLHLGTPVRAKNPAGGSQWFNSVLSIHRGKIEAATHKSSLLPIEESFGMRRPAKDLRKIRDGSAVLICAELFLYALNKNNALKDKNVQQIFAPTMWATPVVEGYNSEDIEKAGGEDSYYRQQLEKVVGSYLLPNMPTVNRVITADRGRPDLAPYNAVFDRTSK